jgi:rubrerythrin
MTLAIAAIIVVAAIFGMSVGLAIVEFRRVTPLAFRCTKCGTEFRQPPHREFPRECPTCGASDWPLRA